MTPAAQALAVPPPGDEPLDEIERAFVRAVVSALLTEIRREEAAARAPADQADVERRGR